MKYKQNEEFDLQAIYLKLLSPSKYNTVKACDFFNKPTSALSQLQKRMKEAVCEAPIPE